jgi:hypothetical protein
MDNLMRHLSGWRIAYDSETREKIFFNDLTMSRHCYSIEEVYAISCQEDIADLLAGRDAENG